MSFGVEFAYQQVMNVFCQHIVYKLRSLFHSFLTRITLYNRTVAVKKEIRKISHKEEGNPTLDSVTTTIVELMGSVDLYHYNKLAFLFEYFYIKNFGTRFTEEQFTKLPHGPTINSYKKQIQQLAEKGIVSVPLDDLKKLRTVDEKLHDAVFISKTEKTTENSIQSGSARKLIESVVSKFGNMSHAQLEAFVYATPPLKKYMASMGKFGLKQYGSPVLDSRCIKISDYSNETSKARKFIAKLEPRPRMTPEQREKYDKEFDWMQSLKD